MQIFEPEKTTILLDRPCHLGEGAGYDREGDTAWWFDILSKTFFEHRFRTGETVPHALPFMGSQASFVDGRRYVIASDEGLFLCDLASGELHLVKELESSNAGTRSNDGRIHPSGALWIGTMGRKAEHAAGSIYWFRKGELRRLFADVTIPNAICFSPDGATGYYADTDAGKLMRVPLDPATGLPSGDPAVLYDSKGDSAGLDGAVVDADGTIWVARWSGGCVSAFDPGGKLLRSMAVPARQVTCPAFVGSNLDRMLVTTAHEGMDAAARAADTQAGKTFLLDFPMRGREDPRMVL